jgi:hypothetical protein
MILLLLAVSFDPYGQPVRIACAGNSVTKCNKISNPQVNCYTSVLETMLDEGSEVGNFGEAGACILRKSLKPFYTLPVFNNIFSFNPDMITIMLGTNDSKEVHWQYRDDFKEDLNWLIDTLSTIGTKPQIFLCMVVPVIKDGKTIRSQPIREEINPAIADVARQRGIPCIDLYTPFLEHDDYYIDGIHPDVRGERLIAELLYDTVSVYIRTPATAVSVRMKPGRHCNSLIKPPLHFLFSAPACMIIGNKRYSISGRLYSRKK